MKRFFIRELAVLLVLALAIPTVCVAEDIEVDMAEDALELEDVIDAIEMDALELAEVEPEGDVPLDGLALDSSSQEEGAGDSEPDMEPVDVANAVTKKYGVPTQLTLGLKETFALKCTKKKLTYKSSAPKLAKVDAKGVVTALKKGKATITVYSNKKKLTTCKVTVVAAPKAVSLGMKSATLGVKEKLALAPQITKNSHTSLTYTVKNSKVATVTKAGVVTGKKAGTTTVTVATHNGKKATLKVTVKKAPTKVTLKKTKATLQVGDTLKLKATLPKGQTSKITWKSSNINVAYVDRDGVVTALSKGSATITASTYNKKKATCKIKVNDFIEETVDPRGGYENVLDALEKLEEEQESFGIEDMTFEKLPTQGINDKALLKDVKEFNSAQTSLKKEMNSFTQSMAKLSSQCEALDSAAEESGIALVDNKLAIAGIDFSIDFDNVENIGENAEILSVKASEDGMSIAIQVRSGGKEYVVQCDSQGLRVLDGGAAQNALANHRSAVTSNAILAQNGFWSNFGEALMKGVESIESAAGMIGDIVGQLADHAQAAFNQANMAYIKANALWEVRQANPNDLEYHLIDENQLKRAASNMQAAEKTLVAVKKLKGALSLASLKFTIETIKDTNKKIIELGKIWNHNHPTFRDREDPEKLAIANKLNGNLAAAELGLGINGVMAFIDLATQINDALTFVRILFGPAGFVASFATLLGLKVTKKIVLQAVKKAGVQLVIGSTGQAAYLEVLRLDKLLHPATVYGTVTDEDTGDVLSGVSVKCGDKSTVTDDNGYYLMEIEPGTVSVVFSLEGYLDWEYQDSFSPDEMTELDAILTPLYGSISGKVINKSTNEPMAGVAVKCRDHDEVLTDDNGCYSITNLSPGEVEVRFSKAYYGTVIKKVTVEQDKDLSLDAVMDGDGVPIDEEHFPDEVFRAEIQRFDSDRNGYLREEENMRLKEIMIRKANLTSLEGIRYLKYVDWVSIEGNAVQRLDFHDCDSIRYLYCDDNSSLTSIDVSGCIRLTELNVKNTSVSSLDLNGCRNLTGCWCSSAKLTRLRFNKCARLTYMECNDNQITSLNINGCASLQSLNCRRNLLTSLDISGNQSIKTLDCRQNSLTKLNVTYCLSLENLYCTDNQLTQLDVKTCSSLRMLYCDKNKLATLDISRCPKIWIVAYDLDDTELIGGFPGLKYSGVDGKVYVM